jgi:hypothetical protein
MPASLHNSDMENAPDMARQRMIRTHAPSSGVMNQNSKRASSGAIDQGGGQSKRGRYGWRADRYFNWINRTCVVQTPTLHDKELYIQTHGRNEYQEGNLGEHIVS